MTRFLKCILSFIFTVYFLAPLAAQIHETNEISTVLDYVNQDCIVFFNITGTLYEPSNALSDNQWREYFSKRVKQIVSDASIGQTLVDRTKNIIVQKIPKKSVEEVTPQLIAELQSKKIAVLGITKKQASTSYADNFAWITQNHLAQLGIHLDKTLSFLKLRDERPFMAGQKFIYGILFTNKQPEGTLLKEFLKNLQKKPSLLIVVDNSLSSLENIQQALQSSDISFIGLRYGRADAKKAAFDPTLGTIEFLAYMNEGRILSDAEAMQVKNKTASVNYDALLDQYILDHINP